MQSLRPLLNQEEEPAVLQDPPARDGLPSCKCGLDAAFATVAKEGPNKGRQFWACPNNPKAQCGFFQWEDDPNVGGGGSSGECFKCNQPGHWASNCPNNEGRGSSYRGSSSSRGRARGRGRGKR
ncbi:uncharacterized protein IAS62_000038 [Cryptococcus decagattii]|uniref:CCHC-type domain-containing protein n=1 Tax=Cryptococcus decagattii TaxID=1859122 RepID=A0ABZ2AMQ8_9TREE